MRTLRTAGKPVSPLFQEGPPSQSSFSFAETSLSGRAEQAGRGQKVEGMLRASDEIQLHYQILGNGPHPLLIPAMHWSLAGCEELLSHHTLIFYDRHRRRTPGEPWPSVSSLSWELETLCRYLGLAQVSLLGWSRFGNIAAHYAFRHTERIARLILIRPVSPPCELRTASDASLPVSREGDFPGASSCHIPTLVIHGGDDPLPVSASRIWAATLPNARLLTMRGAGPSPWDDTPRAFSAAVTQFLAGAWPEAAVCITAQSA
jgi:pimeloyl-ACP methyl ester carboxylesterase